MWSPSTTATSYSRNMVERVLQSVASTLPHNTRGTPHATGVLARTAGGRDGRTEGRTEGGKRGSWAGRCATAPLSAESVTARLWATADPQSQFCVFVRSFVRSFEVWWFEFDRSIANTDTDTRNTQPVVVSVDSMSWYYRTHRRRHDRRVDWCGSAMHLPAWAERARVGDGD